MKNISAVDEFGGAEECDENVQNFCLRPQRVVNPLGSLCFHPFSQIDAVHIFHGNEVIFVLCVVAKIIHSGEIRMLQAGHYLKFVLQFADRYRMKDFRANRLEGNELLIQNIFDEKDFSHAAFAQLFDDLVAIVDECFGHISSIAVR
jgi:hypothetical protein